VPAGIDSVGGSLAVPAILVVANALVTGTLGEAAGSGRPPRLNWWTRRKLARRLGRHAAPAGTATPLPVLSAQQVTRVLADVRFIAVAALLSDQEAEDLCKCLETVLSRAAGR
jgi:hypothetical protein